MRTNKAPLYVQIKMDLQKKINDGIYKCHEQLPSEVELAKQFGVSRITSKNALLELVKEGIAYRIPGKGTFIEDPNASNVINSKSNNFHQNTKTIIGLIMPEIVERFSAQLISGIETAINLRGYRLMLQQSKHSIELEGQAIRSMIQDGVKGLIIFPVDDQIYNEEILRLSLDKFPVVLIDRYLKGIETSAVYSDNLQGSYDLTKLLLAKGHRKIGIVTAPTFETITVENRIKGYEQALSEVSIPIDKSLWCTEILHENPVDRVVTFLQENQDITSIFAMNAYAGHITYQAAKRIGKHFPEEFSIVSFDQEHELDLYPIFTAKQDSFQMGEKAVDILHSQLNDNNSVQQIVLPVKICFNSYRKDLLY